MALALTLAAAVPASADIVIGENVAFNARKINPYTGGPAFVKQEVVSLIPNEIFDGKIRADLPFIDVDPVAVALEALFGVSLPSLVKAQVGATVAGNANLSFGYYVTAGQLDISYPARSSLGFETVGGENYVLGNQSYSIQSDFLPGVSQRIVPVEFLQTAGGVGYAVAPIGGFTSLDYGAPWFATTSPWAQAWVDASADIHTGIHTKVTALSGVKSWRKDINIDASVGGRLVEVDPSGLWVAGEPVLEVNLDEPYGPVPVAGGAAELTIQVPKLDVISDPINGRVLHARRVKPVVTLTGNLEKLIPFVGGWLHNSIGPFEYDLLQLSGGPQIGLYQDMTFTPQPRVRLTFSEPVKVAGTREGAVVRAGAGPFHVTQITEFDLGQNDVLWKPLFSNSNSITIKPTYLMNAGFRNETGIDVSLLVDVDSLSLKAPFFVFENDRTIGPLFTKDIVIPLFDTELFTLSFTVPIGNVTGSPIVVPKANIGLEIGLGDLQLVSSNFVGFDPEGYDKYDLTFHRAVEASEPRIYQTRVTGRYSGLMPVAESEVDDDDQAFYIESLQDVILTDPVTQQRINVGRDFTLERHDMSAFLPASNPGYADPSPDLGTLYVTRLPADPNIDIDLPTHPILGQYNGSPVNNSGTPIEGSVEFTDLRDHPVTTILVRKGELIPDGIGRFNSFDTGGFGMTESGGVGISSTLSIVPSGEGANGIYFADESGETKLVRLGETVPGSGETIVSFAGGSELNELGQVALAAGMTNHFSNSVVLRGGPDGLKAIARNGQDAPDGGGTFQSFAGGALNDLGGVAFWSRIRHPTLGEQEVIYVSDGTNMREVVREGDAAPGMPGLMSSFAYWSLNNSGRVAFDVFTTAGVQGFYVHDGTGLRLIAAYGGSVPGGGEFVAFNTHDLNEAGQVAVYSSFREFTGGPLMFGLFRGDGVSLDSIAREGQFAPDQDGTLKWQSFSSFQMNAAGQVAFRAFVDAATDYQAILVGDGTGLKQIARHGAPAPDGNGEIVFLSGVPQLNNHGHVAFDTVLGQSDDENPSVLLYDGVNLIQVVRVGQPLAGSTVRFSGLVGMNDKMQVAYQATLANGRSVIARFEPSLYWSKSGSGDWGTKANWSLGIEPFNPYDVFIVAENGLSVTGPAANRTVKSLTLGAPDSARAGLHLPNNVVLTAVNGTRIRPNGVLTGHGTLAGAVVNEGTLSPGSSPGTLTIDGDYTQASSGRLLIEIASPTNHDRLRVSGDVMLGGTLAVTLLDGFVPTLGQQFILFPDRYALMAGGFQAFEFPVFDGLTFAVVESAGVTTLQVVEFHCEDFNRGLAVEGGDLAIRASGIGARAEE
ncbi:MAG: choice-of-anchor tandem repeat NxxGxxAF-containing protein [Verrucomicrobiales bacterium]